MEAPGGGECGGMTAKTGRSLGEEISIVEIVSITTFEAAEPERLGATTMAGSVDFAVQQSF
jgi:hypothetical protein